MVITLLAIAAALWAATTLASLFQHAGFPLPSKDRRFGTVDGLRGYLALAVMGQHFLVWTTVFLPKGQWLAPEGSAFSQMGSIAVSLFFMISGLLFYPRVMDGVRGTDWKKLYISRVFRIIPLLLFLTITLLVIILTKNLGTLHEFSPIPLLKWIIGLGSPPLLGYEETGRLNAYVLWTLTQEWFFYLAILPMLALIYEALSGRVHAVIPIVALLFFTIHLQESALTLPKSIQKYLPLFFMGMFTWHIIRMEGLRKVLISPAFSFVALLFLFGEVLFFNSPYGPQGLLLMVFFTAVAAGNTMFGALETNGALVLGECSYSIYLLHGVVLSLMFMDAPDWFFATPSVLQPFIIVPAALIVTVVCAVTFLFVERPSIYAGKKVQNFFTTSVSDASKYQNDATSKVRPTEKP